MNWSVKRSLILLAAQWGILLGTLFFFVASVAVPALEIIAMGFFLLFLLSFLSIPASIVFLVLALKNPATTKTQKLQVLLPGIGFILVYAALILGLLALSTKA